jgi:hypothetical protein
MPLLHQLQMARAVFSESHGSLSNLYKCQRGALHIDGFLGAVFLGFSGFLAAVLGAAGSAKEKEKLL